MVQALVDRLESRLHVTEIHDDPAALRITVMMPGADAGRAEAVVDLVGDRLQVRLGCTGADHEVIRDCGDFADIDEYDVDGLFIFSDGATKFGEGAGVEFLH